MTGPDTLSLLDLKAFDIAQRIIIASLIEEIGWLKERVARLERQVSPPAPAPDASQEVLDAKQ